MPFLPPNQQRQSTEGKLQLTNKHKEMVHQLITVKCAVKSENTTVNFYNITNYHHMAETKQSQTADSILNVAT